MKTQCPICGKNNNQTEKFCTQCGAILNQNQFANPYQKQTQYTTAYPQKKQNNNILAISVIASIIIAAVIVIALFTPTITNILQPEQKQTTSNDEYTLSFNNKQTDLLGDWDFTYETENLDSIPATNSPELQWKFHENNTIEMKSSSYYYMSPTISFTADKISKTLTVVAVNNYNEKLPETSWYTYTINHNQHKITIKPKYNPYMSSVQEISMYYKIAENGDIIFTYEVPDYGMTITIRLSKDTVDDVLNKPKPVNEDLKWKDIEVIGNCDTSSLGTYVKAGDIITDCYGGIKIIHEPTSTLLGRFTFDNVFEVGGNATKPIEITPIEIEPIELTPINLIEEVIFNDNFNDNYLNPNSWSEFSELVEKPIENIATIEETNQRLEIKIDERGSYDKSANIAGIESRYYDISLSNNNSIVINWDIISDLGSTGWVGNINCELTDGTNYIKADYSRNKNQLRYKDNDDEEWNIIKNSQYDGTWTNQMIISKNTYQIIMDDYSSGIINETIFAQNTSLKLKIYLRNAGTTEGYNQKSAFDNINMQIEQNTANMSITGIILQDNFDDNSFDNSKWTKFYEGTPSEQQDSYIEEKNHRLEITVEERGSSQNQPNIIGIESKYFNADLTQNNYITTSWDIIKDLGSTGYVGTLNLEITDGTNSITAQYNRNDNKFRIRDSNDEDWTVISSNDYDSSWSNELKIYNNKYYVIMNGKQSGFIYDTIFSDTPSLKVKLYLLNAGTTPGFNQKSAFDNIEITQITPEKDELVGYWDFNAITKNKVNDESGYANHGSIYGQTLCSGRSGNALYFNGDYGYVRVSDDQTLDFSDNNEFTLDLHIKRSNFSRDMNEGLLSKGTGAYNEGYNLVITKDNIIKFVIRDNTETYTLYSNTIIQKNQWYHITAIWDGSYLKLYINAELDNQKYIGNVQLKNDNKPMEFGNHWGYTDNNHPYHGIIDEVRMFNYALSNNELTNLS